jgi:hypothetical protein
MMRTSLLFFALISFFPVSSFATPSPMVSSTSIDANGEKVVMTDLAYPDGRIARRYDRGSTLLYQS